MLVLEGRQGLRKSSAAAALAVRDSWFVDDLPDLGDKEAKIQLRGKWIIEVAELATVRKSQIEATKRFLAARVDTYRCVYGLRTADHPRQCVFLGTTNDKEYLRDPTGNRRYWPVKCGQINLTALERDRDQLWAEAVVEYHAGAQWYLMDQEEELARGEQSQRVHVSEFEQDVRAYLTRAREGGRVEIETREVFEAVLGIAQGAPGWAEATGRRGTDLAGALQRAGWEKSGRPGGSRTVYQAPCASGGRPGGRA
jgi:predicted P-loop ATPase